jgi:Raf kinase inhibitor-like YbhB/YbcL family protein
LSGSKRVTAARVVKCAGEDQELRYLDVRSRWGHGTGASHWIAYNVPASKAKLEEGEASASPKDFTGGKNNVGHDHYFGPCGPSGHALHHYVITVIATDIEPGTLKPGLTREELLAELKGHALAPASIVGRYTRP